LTFLEIDLLGVYVAPISLLIIAAWFVTIALPDRGPLRLAGLRVASTDVRYTAAFGGKADRSQRLPNNS